MVPHAFNAIRRIGTMPVDSTTVTRVIRAPRLCVTWSFEILHLSPPTRKVTGETGSLSLIRDLLNDEKSWHMTHQH